MSDPNFYNHPSTGSGESYQYLIWMQPHSSVVPERPCWTGRISAIYHDAVGRSINERVVYDKLEGRFNPLYAELDQLGKLPKDWDSYGAEPPNATAVATAKRVLDVLRSVGFRPSRVMPSAEGGIAIVFVRGKRYADFECFNDGDVLVGLSGESKSPRVYEADMNNLVKEIISIRAFIEAEDPTTHVDGGSET